MFVWYNWGILNQIVDRSTATNGLRSGTKGSAFMQPQHTTPTKKCTKCGETKSATEFARQKKGRDGLQSYCKVCNAAYYAANRDRYIEKSRAYSSVNRERATERVRAWRAANPERSVEYGVAYRAANRKRIAESVRAWAIAHPEKHAAKERRRRASKLSAEGSHTAADVTAQYARQNGRCYYCHAKVGDKYHVDHVVPLSRGGSDDPSNLVIACPTCNLRKHDKLPSEWPEGGRLL